MARGSRRSAQRAEAAARLRKGQDVAPALGGNERREGDWVVRNVSAGDRVYRCPGCDQEIRAVPHVVAWPQGREDERRHWHTSCWVARDRRGPVVQRSRNAPRH